LPTLSVVRQLEEKLEGKVRILYLGSRGSLDQSLVRAAGLPFRGIFSGKLRRYWASDFGAFLLNVVDIFKVLLGVIQAFFIILFFRPDVIFSKGGFVSIPVVISGWLLRIPMIAHESDSILGLANRIALKFIAKLAVGFEIGNYPQLPLKKLIFTGNPLRDDLASLGHFSKLAIKKEMGFSKDLPVVLIIGGSQGAKRINELVMEILARLLPYCNLLHITGKAGYKETEEAASKISPKFRKNYKFFDFVGGDYGKFLSVADLVVSRAGANSITELAWAGKPAILIPLSSSAGEHQTKNARVLEQSGAAVVLDEKKIKSADLTRAILELLADEKKCHILSERIKRFFEPEAASKIASEVIKLAKKRKD